MNCFLSCTEHPYLSKVELNCVITWHSFFRSDVHGGLYRLSDFADTTIRTFLIFWVTSWISWMQPLHSVSLSATRTILKDAYSNTNCNKIDLWRKGAQVTIKPPTHPYLTDVGFNFHYMKIAQTKVITSSLNRASWIKEFLFDSTPKNNSLKWRHTRLRICYPISGKILYIIHCMFLLISSTLVVCRILSRFCDVLDSSIFNFGFIYFWNYKK